MKNKKFYKCKVDETEVFAWLDSAESFGYFSEEIIEVYEDLASQGGGLVVTLVASKDLEVLEEA